MKQILRLAWWLARWVSVVAVVALTGCAKPGSAPMSGDDGALQFYHGVALRSPEPSTPGLPAAWLIVGDRAIAATVPAFSWGAVHADPPPALPNLPAARLRADQKAVIVVAAADVKSFQATVRPWSNGRIIPLFDASARALPVAVRRDGQLTAVGITPSPGAADRLLQCDVRFGDGEAFYLWRISLAR